MMENTYQFNWRALLCGVILIIGSVIAMSNPAATFLTLAIMLGVMAIIRGALLIYAYFRLKSLTTLKLKISLVWGILLAVIGIIFLLKPVFAMDIFAYVAAFWFILDALNNLMYAGLFRPFGTGLFVFNIILNILLLISGVILLFNPVIFGLSISLMVGISLMISGIEHILLAFFNTDLSF